MRKALFAALPLVALLAGCQTAPVYVAEAAPKLDMIAANYAAAEKLIAQLDRKLPTNSTVIMATLVNIDALESSSTLGRGVSEHVMSRFTHAGFNVVEMKFRDSVYMKRNEGELMLTREIARVAQAHAANAVIAGTYAVAGSSVYVNLKVIDPNSNVVMAAFDYELPMTGDVRTLLGKRGA